MYKSTPSENDFLIVNLINAMEVHEKRNYKWPFVPQYQNDSIKISERRFVSVPEDSNLRKGIVSNC